MFSQYSIIVPRIYQQIFCLQNVCSAQTSECSKSSKFPRMLRLIQCFKHFFHQPKFETILKCIMKGMYTTAANKLNLCPSKLLSIHQLFLQEIHNFKFLSIHPLTRRPYSPYFFPLCISENIINTNIIKTANVLTYF